MVYVEYKKHGVTIGHLWFTSIAPSMVKPDIIYTHGSEKAGGGVITQYSTH